MINRFRLSLACVLLCLSAHPAFPQVITTIAGTDFAFPRYPIRATDAPFGTVEDVVVDPQGNVYISDSDNAIIAKLTPDGTITVVAGNGIRGFSGDGGPAALASLDHPAAMALDSSGNLYFVDALRIRKITAKGLITTIAGSGSFGCQRTGNATASAITRPGGLAVDAAGSLYFLDGFCGDLVKIDPNGTLTVLEKDDSGFGERAIAIDSLGNFYYTRNSAIRKRTADGAITTFAGGPTQLGFAGDGGPATNAFFNSVEGLRFDGAGNLYISDSLNNRIRRIGPDGRITTVAGNGPEGGGVSSFFPTNIRFVPGEFSGDGGLATNAHIREPRGLAVDTTGNLFIADSFNHRIRKVTPDGKISTAAGNDHFRYSGDGGSAVNATFNYMTGVAADAFGNVFVADSAAHVIRRISPDGIVSTYAGTGEAGFSGDGGPAAAARLGVPYGVAVDSTGNLYIAEVQNYRIRKVSTTGIITTFASGGNGPTAATQLELATFGVAVDNANRVLVVGQYLYRISQSGAVERLDAITDPLVVTYAVAAAKGDVLVFTLSHPPIRVTADGKLSPVSGIPFSVTDAAGDSLGNFLLSDYSNQRILRLAPDGTVSTIAGAGGGFAGDGDLATRALFNIPWGIATDPFGNVYIADNQNHRIRKILAQSPSFDVTAATLSFDARAGAAPAATQKFSIVGSIPGVQFTATSGASWLKIDPSSGETPRILEVTADPAELAQGTYTATITVTAPNATPPQRTVAVTFKVDAGLAPTLVLDRNSLSFTFPRSPTQRTQTLSVSNGGGGRLPFTATAQTKTGGEWLTVSPLSGEVTPRDRVALTVTANSAGLAPNTYVGNVTVQSGAVSRQVSVTLTVSARDQAILLSQSGLSFTAVAQGGLVPPQSFGVLNLGTGTMPWTISAARGSSWLSFSTRQGSTDASASSVPSVEVRISQTGLAPGRYYDVVRVDSPAAANTPQVVTVFLEVLPANATPGAVVQPAELVFSSTIGAPVPSAQEVLVYNLTSSPVSFRSRISVSGTYISSSPGDAIVAPLQPARIVVQPFTDGLGPGDYAGQLTLQFSDGTVGSVSIRVVVSLPGAATAVRGFAASANCVATELLPSFVALGQGSTIPVGYPAGIVASVQDNCQQPLTKGSVMVSFSNSDAPVSMISQKDGFWHATWETRGSAANVRVRIRAADESGQLRGEREGPAELSQTQPPPSISTGGVVSVAGPVSNVALGPGGAISIYGNFLTEARTEAAAVAPLPNTLAGVEVLLGKSTLPLFYASPTQINAILPFDLEPNTAHQLLVSRGIAYSEPIRVDVGPAQPAVFTTDHTPTGPTVAFAVRGTDQFQVTAARPARAGDILIIYCVGLGAVSPLVPAGQSAPANPLSNVRDRVKVSVGGVEAPNSFAGLSPTYAGLYQINLTLPAGVTKGAAVPLLVEVSGQTSPTATIPIE